jgi:diguanylate cyclase (GGDEF)-like protein
VENELISNRTLVFRIVSSLLVISILVAFLSMEYLKKTAIDTLASDDAKKTAQLVFETMNTRMQEGWTKKELDVIIKRLEHIRKGMTISSYRSKHVEEIFGVVPKDKEAVQKDPLLQKALTGEEIFLVDEDSGKVRFLYPMKMTESCVLCHSNSDMGTVNGVLDIQFPHSDIKISIDTMSLYFVVLLISFLLVLSYIFFVIINRKMVKPVVELTHEIQEVEKSKDLTSRANINTTIKELGILQNSFNKLLETIKFYYDKLIETIYTDDLTSLKNYAKLQKDIESLDNNSLLLIDIKAFGKINRVYGAKVADILLVDFSKELNDMLDGKAEMYRLYGDEFALLSKGKISQGTIENYIKKLKLHKFEYKDIDFTLDVTIGFVDSLAGNPLENANIALKAAKNRYKQIVKYDKKLQIVDEDSKHLIWAKKLENAIENDNLVPYFMPMKNTKTGKIDKYETLVRIIEGDQIITPDKFIDVSYASGKYHLITQCMIRKTFEYFKDIDNIKFSINFALSDILNDETKQLLIDHLKDFKNSENVVIELLETEEISDFELLNRFINEIKQHGAKVAIDDFGSGYSNFNYILNLDVDIIKLDSCLIENIFVDQNSAIIVSSIVRIAKELNLVVVAEKVSSEQIENILTIHEVDYLQGFHIGKPDKDILKEN